VSGRCVFELLFCGVCECDGLIGLFMWSSSYIITVVCTYEQISIFFFFKDENISKVCLTALQTLTDCLCVCVCVCVQVQIFLSSCPTP